MKIEIRQGKGGRWRWFLYENDGKFAGISSIYGWETKYVAKREAKRQLSAGITIEDAEEGELYAGQRDWSN